MRIGCLQFNPSLGKPTENIARANVLLEASSPENLDLLVLPELAFSGHSSPSVCLLKCDINQTFTDAHIGYNHPSFSSILPYLEPTTAGPSTDWAKITASKYKCIVTVGYPELYTPISTRAESCTSQLTAYNSLVTVSPTGEILAHCRKTHLYYTDETWAQESPEGWLSTPLKWGLKTMPEKIVKASFGICMDLNPHKFVAPWEKYELSRHALEQGAEIMVLSMAWLTRLPLDAIESRFEEPDLDTLSYWIERLKPLVEAEQEVLVVCANRCGEEPGKNSLGHEEGVRYAGSSWVGKVGNGQVRIWDIIGRAEEGLCVADTEEEPQWVLRMNARDG